MGNPGTRPLTDEDITRLGVEAGMRVKLMPERPTPEQISSVVDDLGMRAVELAYTQTTNPEEE